MENVKTNDAHSDGIVSYCCICMGIVSDLESRGLSKLVIINTRGLLKLFFLQEVALDDL